MIIRQILNLRLIRAVIICVMTASASYTASSFSPDTYATHSVLAEGRWVKISVKEDGMHFIPASTLRRWGFNDVNAVNVYGYGGRRISDEFKLENYVDDLPVQQCIRSDKGIYFYACGPTAQRRRSEYISPQHNPFSTLGYYYLSDRDATPRDITSADVSPHSSDKPGSYQCMVWHEEELVSPGEIGHLLVGEDFRYNQSQTFTLDTPGRVEGSPAYLEASFVTHLGGEGRITYSVNGSVLNDFDNTGLDYDLLPRTTSSYAYGNETVTRREFTPSGTRMSVGVKFATSSGINRANLNYIAITYERLTALSDGSFNGTIYNESEYVLGGATTATHILDVTDPLDIKAVKGTPCAGGIGWSTRAKGNRTYAAFNDDVVLPAPEFVSDIANQDLHACDTPDMVIITVDDWQAEAERLAAFHRDSDDKLKVLVVPQSVIPNEFGSGSPDVNALRRMLKMFYDRPADDGTRLRYVLLMGRANSDNRRLSPEARSLTYPTMPTWMEDSGLHQNQSFTTDDYFAFLEDGSGRSPGSDRLSVAVGRLPVKSTGEARAAVNKIISYVNDPRPGEWRNRMLLVADDGDANQHISQAESMLDNIAGKPGGGDMHFKKLYIDSYIKSNGTYPQARKVLFQTLDEGVVWWNYNGHASPTAWTHDGLMTYSDIKSMYLRFQPFIYAATCDFMRWDCAQVSGAEMLFFNEGSGTIGTISATRPVYISENGDFTNAIGRFAFARREDGRRYTIGEIMQYAKNDYRDSKGNLRSNTNKLRYVLLGDPAMRLAVPEATAVIDEMAGIATDDKSDPPVIKARQQVNVTGHVTDSDGNPLKGYDGMVHYTMYDAEHSVTTNANDGGNRKTFEEQGGRLVTGRARVTDGRFSIDIAMPSEVSSGDGFTADNMRPAALNLFVDGGTTDRQAATNFRDFFIFDTDWDALPDNSAPVIENMYLNVASFADGDIVNGQPMLFATISDDKGLNMSQAGIGHQMMLTLDGSVNYSDVSNFYTPADDGSPSGIIAYPLSDLPDGMHTLRLRVWDTSLNSAVKTIEFGVDNSKTPVIYDIYTDANPASSEANFYLVHDRPDQAITVTLTVFNLLGKPVWTSTTTQRSDVLSSSPITWNLCDDAGRRVRRGIYLYRATISQQGIEHESNTATRRIAVTGG